MAPKRRAQPSARKRTQKPAAKKRAVRKAAAKKPATKVFDSDAAPRCRSRIPVEVHVGGRIERATIADLSASGARLVGAPLEVARGTPLEIRYRAFAGSAPKPLRAEYIRATEDGFAVRILPKTAA
jgi:hypothetical protein